MKRNKLKESSSSYDNIQPYDYQFITAIEKEIKRFGFDIYIAPLNQRQKEFTASLSNYKDNVSFVYQSSLLKSDGEAVVKLHYYAYDDISYGVFEDLDTGIFTPIFKGYNQSGKVIGSDIKKYLKRIQESFISNKRKSSLQESTLSAITELDTENSSDEELLRIAIASELSAINLYKTLARETDNYTISKLFSDIAREEQVHVGEFQQVLELLDTEELLANQEGKEEAKDLLS